MCALQVGARGQMTLVHPEAADRMVADQMLALAGRIERLVGISGGLNAEMTEKRRSRISIGLYSGADVLWPTVVRLLDRGFAPEQLGLASLATTVDTLGQPGSLSITEWRRVEGLLAGYQVVEGPGGLMLAASRNVCLPTVERAVEPCAGGAISLRAARVWSELEAPIAKGATALAMIAPSTEQQWRGTRILLEHSAYPVQTHDIRTGSGPCVRP